MGESALALIRLSGGGTFASAREGVPQNKECGPGSIELLASVFSRPEKLRGARGNSVIHGWIVEPKTSLQSGAANGAKAARKKIDEVMVNVYRAPKSYTGEDGADISCHGGIASIKAVMDTLKKAGFREALPGEFSFRAFMNGKLDLTRAESVMELVSAGTQVKRERAVRRLSGALEKEISSIKSLLVEVLAGAEIFLDYSEDEFFDPEGGEETSRLPGGEKACDALLRLKSLAASWQRERLYAEGALAVLAGRPNAGKSSLFNYLIREDRSIVTENPGTTRDWIEASFSIEGIPLRIADTAGLRDAGSGKYDEAERIGIKRSIELLETADIVFYVIDGTCGLSAEDGDFLAKRKDCANGKPLLILWNKSDLAKPPLTLVNGGGLPGRLVEVSAKTGEGISAMIKEAASILEEASGALPLEAGGIETGPGSLRQKELIDAAIVSLDEALELSRTGEPLDIIAPLIRAAVNALGEITGEVSTPDILDAMFSRFCVGK